MTVVCLSVSVQPPPPLPPPNLLPPSSILPQYNSKLESLRVTAPYGRTMGVAPQGHTKGDRSGQTTAQGPICGPLKFCIRP